MRWAILLIAIIASPARAELPFLEDDNVGHTPVKVHGGTVAVSGISAPVTISSASAVAVITTVGSVQAVVSVSGGTGFVVFSATGTMRQCSIVPPVGAGYDFDINTEGTPAFPILGRTGLIGQVSLFAKRILLGAHRMIFSNATLDGSYNVRCVFLE